MDIQDWSTTAASNTDIDGTDIGEGCDPGNINNAIRAAMANIAALRDLVGGAHVSGGTANAQTLTTGLSLISYAQGLPLAFEAGATNSGAMTMNVDAIGAKAVKRVDGSDPPAGAVTAGGIYLLAYEANADVLLLLNPTPRDAIAELADDTTPQLGGDLDINGKKIISAGNGNVEIDPAGNGAIVLGAAVLTAEQDIQHAGDTDTKIVFGTDTEDFRTGGSSRLDISNSGVRLGGTGARVTAILDQDNMSSNSDTALATQQSIKAYADTKLALAGGTLSGEVNLADNLLTRPKIKDYGETVNALGSGGGTRTVNLELGNVVTATVSSSTNTFSFTNPSASGTACSFTLILTNGGSQTVNWPASVDWADGDAPDLTASGVDILTFLTTNGGTTWYGFAAGLDMK